MALLMPVPLSYYSPLVGGLPGAARLGMEPTYYWDALDDGALAFLNANTPPGRTVAFSGTPTSFLYLRQTGRLVPGIAPVDPGPPAWLVVQNRPGSMPGPVRDLVRSVPAAFVVARFGVPLLWIIPMDRGAP